MSKAKKIIGFADTAGEWASMVLPVLLICWIYGLLPPAFAATGSAFLTTVALAPFIKQYLDNKMRFSAEIWTDRVVIGETDSGRLPKIEYFLRRDYPSFFRQPVQHLFRGGKWTITVGKINMITGSVSVTKKAVSAIAKSDWLRDEAGTNEVISETGREHLSALFSSLSARRDAGDFLSQDDLDRLETIEAAIRTGINIYPTEVESVAADLSLSIEKILKDIASAIVDGSCCLKDFMEKSQQSTAESEAHAAEGKPNARRAKGGKCNG